jgi:glycosyltransferase involved in cell wall biosynthesis
MWRLSSMRASIHAMKICYFGIYDRTYSRHGILLDGLEKNGIEVIECHADWKDPARYKKLWKQLKALDNEYDYIFAAYPSSVPAMIARFISKKPVIIDAFYSNFDSVVNDRKKYTWYDPRSLKMLIFDWLGVLSAHLVITDTKEHAAYWSTWWGMKHKKMGVVYIGADENMFVPMHGAKKDHILVLFHGTFIPLQGTPKIVEAAHLCASDPQIQFRMIGNGRDLAPSKKLAEMYGLTHIEFAGMKPLSEINAHLAEADIVLGIFGDTAKTFRVIPNKVYEGAAVRKPIITRDTKAIREVFDEHELQLVDGSPQSIADAIIMLAHDELARARYAEKGYAKVMQYTSKMIGEMLISEIKTNF